MAQNLQIDCSTCRTPGSMIATKIPRFNGVVRVIGFFIVIPSVIGVGIAALSFVFFMSAVLTSSTPQSDGEAAGQGIAAVIGGGFFLFIGIVSLIGGLIGWLLIMTKKVFKCGRCGFVLDRN